MATRKFSGRIDSVHVALILLFISGVLVFGGSIAIPQSYLEMLFGAPRRRWGPIALAMSAFFLVITVEVLLQILLLKQIRPNIYKMIFCFGQN